MRFKKNIFTKMNAVIFIFLIPILLLYGISNQASVHVVESLLQKENSNQLEFFRTQMDTMAYSLAMNTVTLSRDPTVMEMEKMMYIYDEQKVTQLSATVQEKLNLQSSASSWYNEISLNFPSVQRKLSTGVTPSEYDYQQLDHHSRGAGWVYMADPGRIGSSKFVYYAGGPFNEKGQIDESIVIVETAFYEKSLASMLDQLKSGGKGDPFMVGSDLQIIYNRTSDPGRTGEVVKAISPEMRGESGTIQTKIDGKPYLINFVYSQPLGFTIVDYTPMQQILLPITTSRNLFYGCIALLLVVGFTASYLLYKHVQLPLQALIGVLKRFQNGDFGVRLHRWFHNEFDFVVVRFNDMAEQIQHLFENVYEEQNRSRLATLKMLQAQINPHFLYNCLNFIISSANLGRHEPVIAMAYNLSDYYRYMTRLEDQTVRLRDELRIVRNYLDIHKLRLQRIEFDIEVPEEMLDIALPRLLIQPIVENAVVHGIEPKMGGGRIAIRGQLNGDGAWLTIEDNGVGMSGDQLRQLQERLNRPMDGEIGCGMWNVNQRLKHWFGDTAGLEFTVPQASSGLRIVMYWRGDYANGTFIAG
ncbi:histidine kinase [Paenibacillus thalictri]|uniref:Sensor histidine kinase n=1 Tax=Paenibacillus thalictri TaxID=2527873 RepID=A0A4Q9DFK2_9BACL|nr:histidine kinase [Paenibacillus thalictri]TBL70765.1 sensor histidine kinase [Paenibacillus thalictri]